MLTLLAVAALLAEPFLPPPPLPAKPVLEAVPPKPPTPAVETVRYATLAEVIRAPTPAEFEAFYPPNQPGQPTAASVSVNCTVGLDGMIYSCRTGDRGTPDPRFLKATLAIGVYYRLKPLTATQRKDWPAGVERRFRTNITWAPTGSGVTGVPTLPLRAPLYPPGGRRAVLSPDWTRRPSPDDIGRYYPDRAQRLEMKGRVVIVCRVTGEGFFELCGIETEEPTDMGFGDASLRLQRLFKMRPLNQYGEPVEGSTVRIPIVWTLPQ